MKGKAEIRGEVERAQDESATSSDGDGGFAANDEGAVDGDRLSLRESSDELMEMDGSCSDEEGKRMACGRGMLGGEGYRRATRSTTERRVTKRSAIL